MTTYCEVVEVERSLQLERCSNSCGSVGESAHSTFWLWRRRGKQTERKHWLEGWRVTRANLPIGVRRDQQSEMGFASVMTNVLGAVTALTHDEKAVKSTKQKHWQLRVTGEKNDG